MSDVFKKKLIDDYREIKEKKFWMIFIKEILDARRKASKHCETDKPEEILCYQGMIRAFDLIDRLPDEIIRKAGEIPDEEV